MSWQQHLREWPVDRWIALSALVVAFAAFFVSLYSAAEDRFHKRASVQPRLVFSFYSNDQGAGWMTINEGNGPALVRWFTVYVDDIIQPHWKAVTRVLELPAKENFEFTYLLRGASMAPGIGKTFWVKSPEAKSILVRNVRRVVLEACYCSVYDECWLFRSSGTRAVRHMCSPEEAATKPIFLEPVLR